MSPLFPTANRGFSHSRRDLAMADDKPSSAQASPMATVSQLFHLLPSGESAPSSPYSSEYSDPFCTMLEARTSIRPTKESPVTYVNKGQRYSLISSCPPGLGPNATFETDIILSFHDKVQRAHSIDLWKVWLEKQPDPHTARAIEIDASAMGAVQILPPLGIDRVRVRWTGGDGLRVAVWFNFLSTDFSHLKGVKGSPMRLIVKTVAQSTPVQCVHNRFVLIQSFRDKGAERKHKDEQRQLAKSPGGATSSPATSSPNEAAFGAWLQPYTLFTLGLSSNEWPSAVTADAIVHGNTPQRLATANSDLSPITSTSGSTRLCKSQAFGFDPSYIPQPPTQKYKLCLFIRPLNSVNSPYHAIYLEHFSARQLVHQIGALLGIDSHRIRQVARVHESTAMVLVGDDTLRHLPDETFIEVAAQPLANSHQILLQLYF
ncbi:hypothetical protein H4R34_000652 [Dimargaris verticillata]|uniref:Grh/CP2 DB domain-containing protein n=1 Tax=Dimargaris verticillata TaxID=2761393 RepID=A0A9W8EFQ6_9FUNG|nr:hypothetical protein H4R34_000652 [Dimargaris verticillata]